MKNLAWIFGLLLIGMIYIVGCGSNKAENVTPVSAACPIGSYYSGGNCYGATGVPQQAAFAYNTGFYADNYSGTSRITVTNASKMKELFKFGMGVCDRGDRTRCGQCRLGARLAGTRGRRAQHGILLTLDRSRLQPASQAPAIPGTAAAHARFHLIRVHTPIGY